VSQWLDRLRAGLREHEVTREDNSGLAEAEGRERFTIVREIGRGGMGAVFEAQDNELQRRVALKFLRGRSLHSLERFQVESRTLAKLQHPNVVAVHEVGQLDGGVFLVMDFVDGESLDHRVNRGPLELEEAVRITREVALALAHCHAHDVLHRDVKPGNVLLAEDGRVLLTDFGVAKELDSSRALTKTGAMVGTPAYMPPEQARGQRHAVDGRSDVYALGGTLYEMLTGEPPMADLTLPMRIAEGRAEAPSKKRPEVDADLDAICLKCLREDARARYPSATALQEDLDRYLRGEKVLARKSARPGQAIVLVSLFAVLVALGFAIRALLQPTQAQPAPTFAPRSVESPGPSAAPSYAPMARDPLRLALPELQGAGFAGPRRVFAYGLTEWKVWSLADKSVVAQGRRADAIRHAAASADGTRLAVARLAGLQVIEPATGRLVAEIPLGAEVCACAPSSGEVAFVVDWTVLRWTAGSPRELVKGRGEPRSILYSPDGALLALGSGPTNNDEASPRELLIWDTKTGAQVHRWELARPPFRLAFSLDSRFLAAGDDWGAVRVFDLTRPGDPPLVLRDDQSKGLALEGAHSGPISGLAFGEARALYSASGHSPTRAKTLVNELRLWQVVPAEGEEPGRVELQGVRAKEIDRILIVERAPGRGLLLWALEEAERLEVRNKKVR
jgi:predicted Ser/Thr protein kinase